MRVDRKIGTSQRLKIFLRAGSVAGQWSSWRSSKSILVAAAQLGLDGELCVGRSGELVCRHPPACCRLVDCKNDPGHGSLPALSGRPQLQRWRAPFAPALRS